MDKNELKRKLFEQKSKIEKDFSDTLSRLNFSEKCQKARIFFKETGKETWQKYKSLSKEVRRNILIAAIVASSATSVPIVIQQNHQHQEKREILKHNRVAKQKTEMSYALTDNESFKMLYQNTLPLLAVSMFPTECLVLNPYSDNKNNVQNTIGLGSYWYPKNGDSKNAEWMKASEYFKQTSKHTITAEHALDLVDGWYCYRENGRIYRNLCCYLQGAKLKPNEFAAIASVMYNNEKKGAELCKYVAKNFKDPMKCAQKIVSFKAPNGFSGIDKRHLHEAYLYLNLDDYVQNLYNLQIREGINSKGEHYITTSVTQLSDQDVERGRQAILSGDRNKIKSTQNDITKYITKGSISVHRLISDKFLSDSVQNALFSYSIQSTVSFEKEQQENLTVSPDVIYTEALAHYNNAGKLEKEGKEAKSQKEYAVALETFQKLTSAGYKGADLYNDIAITYYHLGEYQKCIDESRHVLETGEESAYAAANYNAAKAYEKLGFKERAILNYRAAIAHGADTTMCEKAINKLSSSPQMPKLEQSHSR